MKVLEMLRRLICKEKKRDLADHVEDVEKGEVVGRIVKVYIEANLDIETILKALYLIPNHWKFTMKDWDQNKFEELTGDWQNFLLPLEDDEVVIFDGAARKVKYGGGTIDRRVGTANMA